tara:strand:- start:1113 stop:1559 length:447 start_codon:yes stop_codon:yes gene_type:complete
MSFVYFIPDKDGKINSFKQDDDYKYYYGTTYNIENYLNCEYSDKKDENYICKKEDYDESIKKLLGTNREYTRKITEFWSENAKQTITKIEDDDYNMILEGWNNYKKLKYFVDNFENLFGENESSKAHQDSLNTIFETYKHHIKLLSLT